MIIDREEFLENGGLDNEFNSLMGNYLSNFNFKEGMIVDARVVEIDDKFIYVDINFKSIGRVPLYEFASEELPKIGDMIQVVITRLEGPDGNVCVSYEEVQKTETKKKLRKSFENNEKVIGVILDRRGKGFHVNLSGITAFLPDKYIDYRQSKGIENTLQANEVHDFVIVRMDADCNSVVVSRRGAKEIDQSNAKKEFISKFKVGDIIKGARVTNIVDYGAFVNIGSSDNPHDGLLHKNDMSWTKTNHPTQVVSKDQEIDVMVLKINIKDGHISLGMKQLEENPWNVISKKVSVGDKVEGIVSNIVDYGAFVAVPSLNVEGLVHFSEMSWTNETKKPSEIVSINQKIDAIVKSIDSKNNRISLSIRDCTKNPWALVSEKYPKGSEIEVIVNQINPGLGLIVDINDNKINGDISTMIHKNDLSWEEDHIEEKLNSYNVGDKIRAKVIAINPNRKGIKLGVKQLGEDPYQKELSNLKAGEKVICVIRDVFGTQLNVDIKDKPIRGFINRSELSMDRDSCRTDLFKVGSEVDCKVLSVNPDTGKVSLSIKSVEEDNYKNYKESVVKSDVGTGFGDLSKFSDNDDKS